MYKIEEEKVYRMRRGKLVEIPEKWLGVVTTRQTIRKRRSKATKAQRNTQNHYKNSGFYNSDYWQAKRNGFPIEE